MISWTPWQALLRLLRVLRPALRLLHARLLRLLILGREALAVWKAGWEQAFPCITRQDHLLLGMVGHSRYWRAAERTLRQLQNSLQESEACTVMYVSRSSAHPAAVRQVQACSGQPPAPAQARQELRSRSQLAQQAPAPERLAPALLAAVARRAEPGTQWILAWHPDMHRLLRIPPA